MAALQSAAGLIPAPTSFEPLPLVAGQWSQYKMIDDKGQPGFLTYKVLGEEGGAFWIETLHESLLRANGAEDVARLRQPDRPTQIEIRGVVTLDRRGNVNPMPPTMLPMLQSMFRGAVSALVVNFQGLPQESAAVPAGRFDGCFRARSEAQWGP